MPQTFRDFIPPDARVGDQVEDVAHILEKHGWYPRGLFGSSAVRYWPDQGRPKQILLTFTNDLVRQRVEFFAEHTGIMELLEIMEEAVEK